MMRTWLYWVWLTAEQLVARLTGWHAEHHLPSLDRYFRNDQFAPTPPDRHALVVYAGTIGEWNAIASLVAAYFARWPNDRLVVLLGDPQYFDAVPQTRADTGVGALRWRAPRLHKRFLDLVRPRFVAIAEGPCLDSRFPMPFELGLLAACRTRGVPAYVVNACAYERIVPAAFRELEHRIFGALHKQAIRRWFAPSQAMAAQLSQIGVPADRLEVVGNLKFDGVAQHLDTDAQRDRTHRVKRFAGFREGPIFVGGNVNAIDEQTDVYNAWRILRDGHPGARLVIAPRYLQYENVVAEFADLLRADGVRFALWHDGPDAARDADVVIVDTYGDLYTFYGIATICYAGRNHGVLESLGQGKPTLVSANWMANSGGYEIYRRLVDAGALIQVADLSTLGAAAARLVGDADYRNGFTAQAQALIEQERGAGQRTLEAIVQDLAGRDETCN